MPTCLHFPSQNPPKSFQNPILECIDVSIEVGIDFLTSWARFWRPTWRHVGHFFLQNVGPLWRDPLFFVGSMFFFPFFGHPGSLLAPVGLDFGGSGLDFEGFLEAIFFILFKFLDFIFPTALALCWSTFLTRTWCWMGWWGYAKSKAFILFDLIRFEFSSLRGARILEPKTTTKFWSSRGLQKFVAVLGSRVIDFTWLDSLWISLTSMLKHFLH